MWVLVEYLTVGIIYFSIHRERKTSVTGNSTCIHYVHNNDNKLKCSYHNDHRVWSSDSPHKSAGLIARHHNIPPKLSKLIFVVTFVHNIIIITDICLRLKRNILNS